MEIYSSKPKPKKPRLRWLKTVGLGVVGIILLLGIIYLFTQVSFSSGSSSATQLAIADLPKVYEGNITWKNSQGAPIDDCWLRLTLSKAEENKPWINFSFEANISKIDTTINSLGNINLTDNTIDLPGLGKGTVKIISKENINLIINKNWELHSTH
ncbi:MAG TPA: hypothetical protein DCS93_07085 [Microscillaceae bacterium]|nr:hypothetical protein [Microscillaceae bacterium]